MLELHPDKTKRIDRGGKKNLIEESLMNKDEKTAYDETKDK